MEPAQPPRKHEESRYVIAVKREMRGRTPADLKEEMQKLPGVKVESESGSDIWLVRADAEGLKALKQSLGKYCHIEPEIFHDLCDVSLSSAAADAHESKPRLISKKIVHRDTPHTAEEIRQAKPVPMPTLPKEDRKAGGTSSEG